MTVPDATPVTVALNRSDLGYIVDALLDAAEKRHERAIQSGVPDGLHARIGDHLASLALMLHDAQPDRIEALP
jgi:hypothetical protein